MMWLKAFHIIGVVSWFAGLLYLPRLFVYHAQIQRGVIDEPTGNARFKIMERKLFMIMTIGALLVMRWLQVKLVLVLVLIGYHGACLALVQQFAADRNARSERWYRLFNEVPALLLVAIVILVTVKPF
jgi:putative membrane protein